MLPRTDYLQHLENATARSPITALLGPRQCGKTTLARQFAATRESTHFDLESEPDVRRLANPELALGSLDGLVVPIQAHPLFCGSYGKDTVGFRRNAHHELAVRAIRHRLRRGFFSGLHVRERVADELSYAGQCLVRGGRQPAQ